jgi:response regulator RpfG family c-di-GMP phosphodiesterase
MTSQLRLAVLALDDEPDNLEFIARTLRPDFEVVAFTSPVEAIRALQGRQFAVIVCDQRMPQMTGVEFLTQAAQMYPDSARLLVTAYADLSVALDAVNRGRVSAILCKPVEAQTLTEEVRRGASTNQNALRLREQLEAMQKHNRTLAETVQRMEQERQHAGRPESTTNEPR